MPEEGGRPGLAPSQLPASSPQDLWASPPALPLARPKGATQHFAQSRALCPDRRCGGGQVLGRHSLRPHVTAAALGAQPPRSPSRINGARSRQAAAERLAPLSGQLSSAAAQDLRLEAGRGKVEARGLPASWPGTAHTHGTRRAAAPPAGPVGPSPGRPPRRPAATHSLSRFLFPMHILL